MIMKRSFSSIVCMVALFIAATAFAGQPVEIKLKDGSRWRGEVDQTVELRFVQQGVEVTMTGKLLKVESLFIVVDGEVGGRKGQKTIFKSDVVTMKTVGQSAPPAAPAKPTEPASKDAPAGNVEPADAGEVQPTQAADKGVGVFVLPMSGMV